VVEASLDGFCLLGLRFLGLDYPDIPREGITRHKDFLQGLTSWEHHLELWRLYQSAQFVHLFAFQEDWWSESEWFILPAQLSFAPGVLDTRQPIVYDIEAKAEPEAIASGQVTRDGIRQMQAMLRQLLADRFKLKVHMEKKVLPVYTLVVDNAGLKLQKAPVRDCDGMPSACGWKKAGPASGVIGYSVRLDGVAGLLSVFLDRSVVDRTNVTDAFDVNLPPFSRGTQLPGATADGVPVDVTAPSVFAVLRDVGLRLEPQNEPLDVYVVDHVERPTVN